MRFYNDNILNMELEISDKNTIDFKGDLHQHLLNNVTEDVTRSKEI